MQFEKRTVQRFNRNTRTGKVPVDHVSNLCMYDDPPSESMTLDEFEDIAKRRLAVLKTVEDLRESHPINGQIPITSAQWQESSGAWAREMARLMPIAVNQVNAELRDKYRREDVIGHYILRLAFCRSIEDSKWFITQELELFRFRFLYETRKGIEQFLRDSRLGDGDEVVSQVDDKEKEELSESLAAGSGISIDKVLATNFWKMDLIDALDLVRKRRVFLRHGFAYVPYDDMVVIVVGKLRGNISSAMARAKKHIGLLGEEKRIVPRLAGLIRNTHDTQDYTCSASISRHQIDSLSRSSFPLCMRIIHKRLRADHHLRHGGRMQYGLFLKAIGLSLEEALAFMREEFTKKMDSDKFDKQYAYNIRHQYGKEGNKRDYSAFSCAKIILGPAPALSDCHGCPFRHADADALAKILAEDGIPTTRTHEILTLAKEKRFDRACTRHLEVVHDMTSLGELVTHPNQYFAISQDIISGKRSKDGSQTQVLMSQTQSQSCTDVVMSNG